LILRGFRGFGIVARRFRGRQQAKLWRSNSFSPRFVLSTQQFRQLCYLSSQMFILLMVVVLQIAAACTASAVHSCKLQPLATSTILSVDQPVGIGSAPINLYGASSALGISSGATLAVKSKPHFDWFRLRNQTATNHLGPTLFS
jgi:hypothetical protein